jgi:uncharacterized protein YprB with RNaseH-like and TPR domain
MLTNTFCHLNGVGLKREAQLWASGIRAWDALVNSASAPFSQSRMVDITKEVEQSYVQLSEQNSQYFAKRLNSSELWRIIPEFYDSIAFLDIETTGLNSSVDDITTIALYDGQSIYHYIHGKNLDAFTENIRKYKVLVTYNGKCFDIPFIERYFNITIPHAHIDLRFILKSLGYTGGLKNCETQIGIHRGDAAEIDGFLAIFLWNEYKRHRDDKALECLLSYNIEDVLNLEFLMTHCYNSKIRKTPFSRSHVLDIPEKPENPFTVDVETVAMIRREFYGR